MATYKELLKTHPEKLCLKFLCDYLYYAGAGVCWYEEPKMSERQKRLYKIWCVISNIYILGGMLNQYLANLRTDLTEKEKFLVFQFGTANFIIVVKMIVFYTHKKRILILLEGFLEQYREFSSIELDRSSMKKGLKYSSILFIIGYATIILMLIETINSHFKEGTPIRNEVTLWPTSNTPSLISNLMSIIIEFHLYYACTLLMMIDSICVFSLVFLGFKFKRLQTYFEELRITFLENLEMKSRSVSEKEFVTGFTNGIKLHKHALWCARHVQDALGNLYSIQVAESLVLLVVSLFKMVTAEHNITTFVSNLSYFSCVVIFTGAYMMAGGDVTNEAALVPMSIFHSGWELGLARRDLRTLAVVALINSQVPVLMTAFGIISLSYTNFLMIMRHSYSFFAVMY